MKKIMFAFVFLFFCENMLAQNFIDFPENFEFGLANAPAHAEDELNDSGWILQGLVRSRLSLTRLGLRIVFNFGLNQKLKLIWLLHRE